MTLIDQVFWKTNQIILGVISGTAAVTVYSTASIVYMGYMQLSVAISGGVSAACDGDGGGEGDGGEIVRTFHSDRPLAVLSSWAGGDRIHYLW